MLCVANPVTEPTTGALLRHFARQAGAFENERIGLTSRNTRVVPSRVTTSTRPDGSRTSRTRIAP